MIQTVNNSIHNFRFMIRFLLYFWKTKESFILKNNFFCQIHQGDYSVVYI